jgi:hypothetical protein
MSRRTRIAIAVSAAASIVSAAATAQPMRGDETVIRVGG